jgi:hypothetical protein
MRFLHVVDEDALMAPGTGLFVVRDSKRRIVELSLIVAYNSAQRDDFLIDYDTKLVRGARVRKWWRWTLSINRDAPTGVFVNDQFVPFDSDPPEEDRPPRFQWEYAKGRDPVIEPDSKITVNERKTVEGRLGFEYYPPNEE